MKLGTSNRRCANRTYQPHEFAPACRSDRRALHHYDWLGLLKPSGRTLLYRKDMDPSATLRQQRHSLAKKRDHLDKPYGPIERAEAVASGQKPDWEPFRKIIEVTQMQTRKELPTIHEALLFSHPRGLRQSPEQICR